MHDFYPAFHSPNTLSRIYLALAIVDDQTFQIDGWLERFSDIQDKAEYQGHFYSDKAPGYSVLLVPLAQVARFFVPVSDFVSMAVLLRILGLSIPVVLFWLLVRPYYSGLAGDRRRGDAVVLAGAFGTPFFIYATQLYSHAMAGILLFASFRLLGRPVQPGSWSYQRAAVAGALAGISFTVDYIVVLAVPALLAAAWFTRERDVRELSCFTAGCATPLLAWMTYNLVCFDNPLRVGFHLHADPVYGEPYRQGFFGIQLPAWSDLFLLTISPARGLFFHAPVLAVGIWGLVRLHRDPERRYDALACAGVVCGIVAFAATTVDPGAGWSVTSRYLVPAIPFLLAGVAAFLRDAGAGETSLFVGLALVGVILVPMIAVTFPAFPVELTNPVHQLVWPLVREGNFGPTHLQMLGGASPAAFLLLFAVVGAGLLALAWRAGAAAAVTSSIAILALILGLQGAVPQSAEDVRLARIGTAYVQVLMGYREDPRAAAQPTRPDQAPPADSKP